MSEPEVQQPDLRTTAGKIADLQRRIHEATHAGSEREGVDAMGVPPAHGGAPARAKPRVGEEPRARGSLRVTTTRQMCVPDPASPA
ncbi:hypothetical protein SHIRM173S_03725 [Streptomyces hirsutus]